MIPNIEQNIEQNSELESDFDLSRPHISRDQIQKILGMRPHNLEHYRRALVHKSVQKTVKDAIRKHENVLEYVKGSNERLEFLGDSIFGAVIADILFKKYPNQDEGFMTRMKTKIVRSSHCAKFATKLGLENHILTRQNVVGIKDISGKKVNNDRILEDAFEAFIGAIYLDLGFNSAFTFLQNLVDNYVDFESFFKDDNYKDIVMRYSQASGYELPIYELIKKEGPPHNRVFLVSISIKKDSESEKIEVGLGEGGSKKAAEQAAAKASICKCRSSACEKIHVSELNGIIDRDRLKMNNNK